MMVAGGQERGKQGDGWNEKNLSLSWTGSGLLSCAFQDHRQRRHPKLVVVGCSFALRVRGEYEKCWRGWKVGSRCVESLDADVYR